MIRIRRARRPALRIHSEIVCGRVIKHQSDTLAIFRNETNFIFLLPLPDTGPGNVLAIDPSKDPRPEDVALICPQRRLVSFELKSIVYWSNGVVE